MSLPRIRLTERQVLMMLMGITLLAVLGSFFWSTLFIAQATKPLSDNARVRWMRPLPVGARLDGRYLVSEYFDPSVLSLPNPRGFSRAAWSQLAPPAEGIYEPDRSPSFLPPPSGLAMPELLPQPPLNQVVVEGLLLPQPEDDSTADQLSSGLGMAATNSAIQIGGDLMHREVVRQPNLPMAPAGVPVHGARVQIAVTPDGQVRYAVLDRSSGNEPLDTQAVALAGQLRFNMAANVDPLALTWGTVQFLWAVAPSP